LCFKLSRLQTGSARWQELKAGLCHVEDHLLQPLDDDERALLRTMLRRLATNLVPLPPDAALGEPLRDRDDAVPLTDPEEHLGVTFVMAAGAGVGRSGIGL
jgi:hypothetical protein